jgi:hypothetical protein
MDKYNSKGSPDPTAAEALVNVARKEKLVKSFSSTPYISKHSDIYKGYPVGRLTPNVGGTE